MREVHGHLVGVVACKNGSEACHVDATLRGEVATCPEVVLFELLRLSLCFKLPNMLLPLFLRSMMKVVNVLVKKFCGVEVLVRWTCSRTSV